MATKRLVQHEHRERHKPGRPSEQSSTDAAWAACARNWGISTTAASPAEWTPPKLQLPPCVSSAGDQEGTSPTQSTKHLRVQHYHQAPASDVQLQQEAPNERDTTTVEQAFPQGWKSGPELQAVGVVGVAAAETRLESVQPSPHTINGCSSAWHPRRSGPKWGRMRRSGLGST